MLEISFQDCKCVCVGVLLFLLFLFKLLSIVLTLGSDSDWLLKQFTVVNTISACLKWITVKLLRLGQECRCGRSVLPVSVFLLHMAKIEALQSWNEVGFWVKNWSVKDNQVPHSDQEDWLCIYWLFLLTWGSWSYFLPQCSCFTFCLLRE